MTDADYRQTIREAVSAAANAARSAECARTAIVLRATPTHLTKKERDEVREWLQQVIGDATQCADLLGIEL